jgi:hypothetical protein
MVRKRLCRETRLHRFSTQTVSRVGHSEQVRHEVWVGGEVRRAEAVEGDEQDSRVEGVCPVGQCGEVGVGSREGSGNEEQA